MVFRPGNNILYMVDYGDTSGSTAGNETDYDSRQIYRPGQYVVTVGAQDIDKTMPVRSLLWKKCCRLIVKTMPVRSLLLKKCCRIIDKTMLLKYFFWDNNTVLEQI